VKQELAKDRTKLEIAYTTIELLKPSNSNH